MTVAALIHELSRQDVKLMVQNGKLEINAPAGVLTDDVVSQLREHKTEILTCLADKQPSPVDGGQYADFDNLGAIRRMEARRQEILKMMADDDQDRKYHYFTDIEADPDYVILAVGIRGVATFEMKIPREKYDPFLLLETIAKEH